MQRHVIALLRSSFRSHLQFASLALLVRSRSVCRVGMLHSKLVLWSLMLLRSDEEQPGSVATLRCGAALLACEDACVTNFCWCYIALRCSDFWLKNYSAIKGANMKLPILLRESAGTQAKLTAAYGASKRTCFSTLSPHSSFEPALMQLRAPSRYPESSLPSGALQRRLSMSSAAHAHATCSSPHSSLHSQRAARSPALRSMVSPRLSSERSWPR
eukprot:6177725-Pleurochrysis_carterae.AAC.4